MGEITISGIKVRINFESLTAGAMEYEEFKDWIECVFRATAEDLRSLEYITTEYRKKWRVWWIVICETEDIRFFGANVLDLSNLSPVQLLLVKDKISSREIIHLDQKKIDSSIVLLRSTIKDDHDYKNVFKKRQATQLKATCELLWKYCQVRTYYSTNGKKFYQFKF